MISSSANPLNGWLVGVGAAAMSAGILGVTDRIQRRPALAVPGLDCRYERWLGARTIRF